MDTDTLEFDKLVGLLKAEEMEASDDQKVTQKSIAFAASGEVDRINQVEENLSLLAKNFNKMLKRVEKGQNRFNKTQRSDTDRGTYRPSRSDGDHSGNFKKRDVQCHECEGFGHFKSDCPLTKRKKLKCIECKGYGHTRNECPNNFKSKDKSLIVFEDSDSDDEEEEGENLMLNFVAFTVGETDCSERKPGDSDSDSDGEDIDLKVEYRNLYDNWVKLSSENLQLLKDKALMKAQLNILEMERTSSEENQTVTAQVSQGEVTTDTDELRKELNIEREKRRVLEERLENLKEVCHSEKEKARDLQSQLVENHKKIRMLNTGSENLDQILSSGQPPKKNWGLGYTGGFQVEQPSSSSKGLSGFVFGGTSSGELTTTSVKRCEVTEVNSKKDENTQRPRLEERSVTRALVQRKTRHRRYFCHKTGHKQRNCFKRKNMIKKAWSNRICYPEPKYYGMVWICKQALYTGIAEDYHGICETQEERCDAVCNFARISVTESETVSNVAYTSTDGEVSRAWYFDSGCSRHMTGNQEWFDELNTVKGGQVTFGNGGQGRILGVGALTREDQPKLVNVFYVHGLKANLISVSQLCDEGLEIIFTRVDCKAIDEKGNTVMYGIKSGNNCYMWSVTDQCLSARQSQLDLWHKRLGHMNVNGLTKLVKAEVVRGIPPLESETQTLCGACQKGKQVKVQHKALSETRTSRILKLMHMDLMGPISTENINGERYIFVMVDDFSRYTLVSFLREKSEAASCFKILALQLKNEKGGIVQIRSDHGGEFQSEVFEQFCHSQGIRHQFSAPRTPQQNGVVERKNRTLQEMARAMLHGNNVSPRF
ncbi:uncharacterized protein LOC112083381 [Eutrema salsugineum]|uniref:uncharacterized protein LOC112083381 n=1 Tax=Eutrema salsugineum TaxID=72664 RepID=UPI000CED34BE|nr:uncharacterized protein LOC112083381 [Eutrema salsugineum]